METREIKAKRLGTFRRFLDNREKRIMVLYGGAGSGKCFQKGTEIIMADGQLKKVEDVKIGDNLMGIDSTPRTVLETHTGYGNLFLIKQRRGINYVVNGEHLLALQRSIAAKKMKGELTLAGSYRRPNGRYPDRGDHTLIDVNDYLKQSKKWRRNFYGYSIAIDFPEKHVSIDPYFLGLWLGDGDKHRISITTMDEAIKDYIFSIAKSYRMSVRILEKKNQNNRAKSYYITNGNCCGRSKDKNPLHKLFRYYNLIKNKHIPPEYLYNSREIRLQVLAGIIDTDGHYGKSGFSIIQKNKILAEQIYYLASSLGFVCSINKTTKTIKSIDFVGDYYRVAIYGYIERIPTQLERKRPIVRKKRVNQNISGVKVEPYGSGRYYGFSIDGDGLFLLKDCTVVHNSHSLAQLFIRRLYEEKNIRMLVLRKTLPALRITAYRLMLDLLAEYQLPFHLNKTEMLIRKGTSEILFKSLDDPEKLKSYEGNYVWIEEATEISYQDFEQLNLRLRRPNPQHLNQMFLTFNPISRFHWLNTKLIEGGRDDLAIHHSMYKDNPFLSKDYTEELENLSDENFYKIYTLGEFGELKNIIYSNYVIGDIPEGYDDLFYGLDFGYNNPSALVEVRVKDGEYYLIEKLYESQLTNVDLIERLKGLMKRNSIIYADSAEPARIEEIKRAGFRIEPAGKSVKDGIDFVKSQRLHVDKNSVNLISELRGYKYKEDRDGNVFDEPVKFRDHIMDAMRYALWQARPARNIGEAIVTRQPIGEPGEPEVEEWIPRVK